MLTRDDKESIAGMVITAGAVAVAAAAGGLEAGVFVLLYLVGSVLIAEKMPWD